MTASVRIVGPSSVADSTFSALTLSPSSLRRIAVPTRFALTTRHCASQTKNPIPHCSNNVRPAAIASPIPLPTETPPNWWTRVLGDNSATEESINSWLACFARARAGGCASALRLTAIEFEVAIRSPSGADSFAQASHLSHRHVGTRHSFLRESLKQLEARRRLSIGAAYDALQRGMRRFRFQIASECMFGVEVGQATPAIIDAEFTGFTT